VTASRVSTERVRKMRFFQEHEYISLDYARRDALRVGVKRPGPMPEFGFEKLEAPALEPLRAELEAFTESVRTRAIPKTDGAAGRAALELASRVISSIREHDARVQPVAQSATEKVKR
jgi:predicted dehydrogenase